jgi:hypothetical protein
LVTTLVGAWAPLGPVRGLDAGFGGAAAFRGAGVGTGFFATVLFATADLTGCFGAAFRTGVAALGFTADPLAGAFFTGLRGRGRVVCFFAGLRTAMPPVRFEGGAAVRRSAGLLVRAAVGFFGAAFRAFATDAAFPEAGRPPGFFLVAFFRSLEAAGRPLPGAAFLGAGRADRRVGSGFLRDLAMVRAR